MDEIVVHFHFNKLTHNKVRYEEDLVNEDDLSTIGTLYVGKHVFGNRNYPEAIKVTIERE